jgi:predicted Zn-dependent peptidase
MFQKENGYIDFLESLGASYNAWTSKDSTSYYSNFHKKDFQVVLEKEILRLQNFNPPSSQIEKERSVIIEEKKQTESSPFAQFFLFIQDKVFNNTSYQHPIIGHLPVLKSITPSQITNFYNTHYNTGNTFIVLTGDLPENFQDILENTLGLWTKKGPDFVSTKILVKNASFSYQTNELPKTLLSFINRNQLSKENSIFFDALVNLLNNALAQLYLREDILKTVFSSMSFFNFSFNSLGFLGLNLQLLESIDYETANLLFEKHLPSACHSIDEKSILTLKNQLKVSLNQSILSTESLNNIIKSTVFESKTINTPLNYFEPSYYYKELDSLSPELFKKECLSLLKKPNISFKVIR